MQNRKTFESDKEAASEEFENFVDRFNQIAHEYWSASNAYPYGAAHVASDLESRMSVMMREAERRGYSGGYRDIQRRMRLLRRVYRTTDLA